MKKNTMDEWNGLNELVYLADTDTYDLLFINDCGLKAFGYNSPDEVLGKKCYKVLQNRDTPCPFCTNHILSLDRYTEWDYLNPLTGRYYLLKDRLTYYDEKVVRMEIALDITYVENERRILKNTLGNERIVMECVRMMHSDTDTEVAINNTLRIMGTALRSDRTYIFEFSGRFFDNTYEWCSPGTISEKDSLCGLSITEISRWLELFEQNQNVIIENLEDYRESEPDEYARLSAQNIHSLVAVPFIDHGHVTGFFGVDNPPVEKLQNISDILTILSYFFQSLLHTRDTSEEMRRLSYYDTLTAAKNRNAFIHDIAEASDLSDKSFGVIFLDVNGLKRTNDQYGHTAGDQLLISVCRKIEEAFPASSLYRTGGDEFVVLCEDIEKKEFDRSTLRLSQSLASDQKPLAAIGFAWRRQPENLQNLINEAENLMYENKKQFYKIAGVRPETPEAQESEASSSDNLVDEAVLKKLCHEIMERYYISGDLSLLMKYASESFAFMEESRQKIFSRREADAYFRQQISLFQEPALHDVTITIRKVSADIWLCCDMAYLDVTLPKKGRVRLSIKDGRLFQKTGSHFTCLFLHSSVS